MNDNVKVGLLKNKVTNSFLGVSQEDESLCPVYKTSIKNGKNALQCVWSDLNGTDSESLSAISSDFTYFCVASRQLSSDTSPYEFSTIMATRRTGPLISDIVTFGDRDFPEYENDYNITYKSIFGGSYEDTVIRSDENAVGEWSVITIVRTTEGSYMYINNIFELSSSEFELDLPEMYTIMVGAFGGFLGDILIYNRALEIEEMTQIYNYLNTKWQISDDPNPTLPFPEPPPPLD